ncbi:hypothetical protein [Blastopirellula retiformator]|uniref:Uncharacterized protein n=1 Tax=Blastopirellula retiformator TaxID=2527970 RepID=A0A5C5V9H8_9BACT|nr:hypothetical protein [Blastopirellula retiformator]TWT34941.1 hypothetical protein Enr8_23570 [Blastopirellula retiformator]
MRTSVALLAFVLLGAFGDANSFAEDLTNDASPTATAQHDDAVPDNLTKLFSYKLAYRPATDKEGAAFTATLTNVSGRKLEVVGLYANSFEGLIDVVRPNDKPFHLMDREYSIRLGMLNTVPFGEELAANQTLEWHIPVESLNVTCDHLSTSMSITIDVENLDRYGTQATPKLLSGGKVCSRIGVRVSMPPVNPKTEWKTNYSILTSNTIEIPAESKR